MSQTLERARLLVAQAEPVLVVDRPPTLEIIVVDDDGISQSSLHLPDILPDWAMPLAIHASTFQRTAVYRCVDPTCNGEHDEYRQNARNLPYAKVCGCIKQSGFDSTILETCTAVALRRTTYPGEGTPVNARGFEPLVIFERANYDSLPDDFKRGHDRYYVPGRNYEPTEPGMTRIEITNIHQYNKVVKQIGAYETQKMRDHRAMHEEYWKARRKAMREDVNARIRHNPTLISLARLIRKVSDRKSAVRYGKALDSHFHAQLIEFDQGKIQDYCDADTGWKSKRAK